MSIKKVLPLQILLLALPLGLLLLSGCEINRLNSARDLYESELYAGAIQALDDLIEVGKNGAIVTRAELIRSDCYLELGKSAIERNNRSLAISFFKLANSEAADVELTRIYSRMAEEAWRSAFGQEIYG